MRAHRQTQSAGAARRSCASPSARRARAFYRRFCPGTGPAEWNDWRWQMRTRIRTLDELARIFRLSEDEYAAPSPATQGSLPVGITPYYASLMGLTDATRAAAPHPHHDRRRISSAARRGRRSAGRGPRHGRARPGAPLSRPRAVPDHRHLLDLLPLLHRARGWWAIRAANTSSRPAQWEQALAYLEAHTEVRDVLLSGGDPLTLGDDKLDWLLGRLRAIQHIEFLRIGTKMPVVTAAAHHARTWCAMLKKHHPLWMSLHFTHPDELTPEVTEATARLADAGIPLGSQTVLLKGINDDAAVMKPLMQGLLKRRVQALLPLSMRSDPRLGPFPHRRSTRGWRSSRRCAATPPAMPRRSS